MKFTPKTCLNRHVRNRRDKWGSIPGLYPPSEPTRRVRSVSHPRKSPFGPFSGIGAAAATRVEIPKVNFAADGFGCSCSLVNAVTVTTPVGCANFGKLSCHYVDSAGLLRVKLVPQDGIFRPLDPYAGDGRVCTPRLHVSVFTLSSASVRRGDHITQISPSHAHAPPPSPRGGKPTVRAARACVRCDDARRVGYAPLRPSRSTRCAGGRVARGRYTTDR